MSDSKLRRGPRSQRLALKKDQEDGQESLLSKTKGLGKGNLASSTFSVYLDFEETEFKPSFFEKRSICHKIAKHQGESPMEKERDCNFHQSELLKRKSMRFLENQTIEVQQRSDIL